MDIIKTMLKRPLFKRHFDPIESWEAWIVVLSAVFGLPINRKQRRTFRKLSGFNYKPGMSPAEIWLVIGRRGGKSKIVALIAVYLAVFFDYRDYLSPGEIGHVMVIATDRKQAKIILRYIEAYFDSSSILSPMVIRRTVESIELNNGIHIMVSSCSLRSVRGYTVVAAVCDEIAFWRSDESANPDSEVLNAIRPAMSTIPTAKLICLSSPYARRGALYETHRDHYGQPSDDVLVLQASTEVMNPTIDRKFLAREEKRDPASFRSEYLAQFRTDIAAALDPDWIEAVLILPNLDLPRSVHPRSYRAFTDMSGGRSDSAALSISHVEPGSDIVTVSLVRRWVPPFSPEGVVQEMAALLMQYGVNSVIGDFYGAELTVELFTKQGISYQRSEESASDIYLQAIPLFSTGKIEAPDNPVLRRELMLLERRTRIGGKDVITHPSGLHDDLANAMTGAVIAAYRTRAASGEIVLGPSMVTAATDYGLVDDFDHTWPEVSRW
ncbi:MAG: hypothetical protein IH974_07180 [Myxococcales bacterium]|nr:hypothetical protein [Myxococcales bacterium]